MVNIAIDWEISTITKLYLDWKELLLGNKKNPTPVLLPWASVAASMNWKKAMPVAGANRNMYVVENPDIVYPWDTTWGASIDYITERYAFDEWNSETLNVNVTNQEWYYEFFLFNEEWERIYKPNAWLQWETIVNREEYPTAKYFAMTLRYWTAGNTNYTAKATIENVGLTIVKQ